MVGGVPYERKYADHKTIIAQFSLNKAPTSKPIQKPKFIKTEDSRARFCLDTDEIADRALKMLASDEDNNKIVKMIHRNMRKAEYKNHKRINPNKPAEIHQDDAIFWSLTRQLEEDVKNIGHMKISNQIYDIRKKRVLSERGDPLFAMNDF